MKKKKTIIEHDMKDPFAKKSIEALKNFIRVLKLIEILLQNLCNRDAIFFSAEGVFTFLAKFKLFEKSSRNFNLRNIKVFKNR